MKYIFVPATGVSTEPDPMEREVSHNLRPLGP